MSDTAFKVIHQVPGRIRLDIPLLNRNTGYGTVLQQQVETLEAVKSARINAIAHSVTIEYDAQALPEADLMSKLTTLIQSASFVDPPPLLAATPDYQAINLTTYESAQFEQIQDWLQCQVLWLTELLGRLMGATKGLLDLLIPAQVLQKMGEACETVTANWQQDWHTLQPMAGVEAYQKLRQQPLEVCDRLTEQVTNQAMEEAIGTGGITALFDIFGEILDDELTLILALQTIHRIGLCYGYAPTTPDEQLFAWAILNAGTASTQAEQQEAICTLCHLHRKLNKQALEQVTLEESLGEDANSIVIDSAIEQGISQLAEETAGGVVPILGIFLSILADRSMIEQVSTAAKRAFQLRWLLENQKVYLPESGTANQEGNDQEKP